jgi:hypothetical protein
MFFIMLFNRPLQAFSGEFFIQETCILSNTTIASSLRNMHGNIRRLRKLYKEAFLTNTQETFGIVGRMLGRWKKK